MKLIQFDLKNIALFCFKKKKLKKNTFKIFLIKHLKIQNHKIAVNMSDPSYEAKRKPRFYLNLFIGGVSLYSLI